MRVIKGLLLIVLLLAGGGVGFLYLAPEKATALAVNAERDLAGLERKTLELPGGLQYVYLEGGQGEPLMLLHGFGGDKDNFTRVARYLTPHYRVIIPDHIGFGESTHLADADYTTDAQAARLNALVQALGVTQLHLGGNSMGGHIAMAFAAKYPDMAQSLWLLNPGGVWSSEPSEMRQMVEKTGENPLLARSEEEFVEIFDFVMSEAPFVPRPVLNVMAQERIRNYELERVIFKQISNDPIEERVRGLETPAMVVWGDQDRVLHMSGANILKALMPRAQVHIMPGIGHVPMIERPEQTAQDYLKYRQSL